ncbi:MAG: hypothetical protein NUV51_02975 [Sulfuricaulis sp.]|nr:hypothetical protein [Sulfuricaulis sp.]
MQSKNKTLAASKWRMAIAVLLACTVSLVSGCAADWVAPHDQASEDRLISAYERINRFYDEITDTAPAERGYPRFARHYADVATDLRVLLLRQKTRANNSESEKITVNILESWEKTREQHRRYSESAERRKNPYPDTKINLDRQQFEDHFKAALIAERAKR